MKKSFAHFFVDISSLKKLVSKLQPIMDEYVDLKMTVANACLIMVKFFELLTNAGNLSRNQQWHL